MAGNVARTGILRQLPRRVAGRQGWRDGRMLRVLLLNVVGYERVSDVGELEKDRRLCRLVRDDEAGAERVKGVAVVPEAAAELQLRGEVNQRLIGLQVR